MMSWMSGKTEETNRVSSKKGYLLKLRRSQNLLAPQWGNRWFSIEGRYFKWYRTESDVSPSGMVNLKFVRNISKVESVGSFAFNISCPDRNLVLRCTNLAELNGWMKALHIHADIARGGNGTNVVSDFNAESVIRNPSAKRNTKLRSSLTLEQEFDLNLKKLDALEKAVHSPDDKKTANRESEPYEPVIQKKFSKPYNTINTPIFKQSSDDYDDYNPTDVLGKLRHITLDPTATKRHGPSKSLNRHDSTSSVEEITMQTRTFSTQSTAASTVESVNNRRKSKEYGESSQATKQRRRRTSRLGLDSEDERSDDEFDTNSDCDNTPPRRNQQQTGRGGGKNDTTTQQQRGRVNSGASSGGRGATGSKLSCISMDSVDSETFHYIPEVSQNDRHSSNYHRPQQKSIRSAW